MALNVLVAWIGNMDLRAAAGEVPDGPISHVLSERSFDALWLLCDFGQTRSKAYVKWLTKDREIKIPIDVHHAELSSPTNYRDIYNESVASLTALREKHGSDAQLTYHLSPGTPAMTAVWILLSKTTFPAQLIQSSKPAGVEDVDLPFSIWADYLPVLDNEIELLTQGLPGEAPAFKQIVQGHATMKRAVGEARRIAMHDVPVLILGESGTGKELFARALHASSRRADGPFIAVNCGAIPENLVESELFGYKRGAFTGANADHQGHVESAAGGVLFLDEIGELPLQAQVKLLRVLQDKKVCRVGETRERRVDFRVIAATNRDLVQGVADGSFREDLFYRVAVCVLRLPPLRERGNDISRLIDDLLKDIHTELAGGTVRSHKKLTAGARKVLREYHWPGNVRELKNVLTRAVVWTPGETISEADARAALLLLPSVRAGEGAILNRPLGNGLDINAVCDEVQRHYVERALEAAHGNKTEAAKLVGLSNYQTLTNWMKRLGME